MEKLERKFVMTPAYDRRVEGYGQHSVEVRFYVIGPKGAVQFTCSTGWYPSLIPKTTFDDWSDWDSLIIANKSVNAPIPYDLGYHAYKAQYEGQTEHPDCHLLNGPCFYDGSGLNAYKPFSILVHEGSERVWEFLEQYYNEKFS